MENRDKIKSIPKPATNGYMAVSFFYIKIIIIYFDKNNNFIKV